MSDPLPPAPRPKKNSPLRLVIVVCGIVLVGVGILQMVRGFQTMKGNPEVERLAIASDTAFNQANKLLGEAAPVFQAVLDAVDSEGLEAVRTGKKDAAAKAATLYAQAAELLREAAQKAHEAAALKPAANMVAFLETKAEAYRNFASARDINRDIARMVLDEKIRSGEELVPQVLEAAGRRDKLEASANEAVARADQLVAASRK